MIIRVNFSETHLFLEGNRFLPNAELYDVIALCDNIF
ncbi:hypothetical protein T08_3167 [Trichinella sp. T8]|nr:hypothetical protein T08_3167 [Trichinella sp. T8]